MEMIRGAKMDFFYNTQKKYFKKLMLTAMIIGTVLAPVLADAHNKQFHLPQPTVSVSSHKLRDFVQQVLENNPAIQAAEANVAAAQARAQASSNPLYNPDLTAEGQSAVDNTYSVGINQKIDWANKRGAHKKIGYANVQVAQAQLVSLRQQLTAQILDALARYQVADQVLALAKKRTGLLQQFVSLNKKLHASGDVARVDVDLAQLALSQALAQQGDAEVNLNQSVQTLMAITGLKHIAWPSLPAVLPKLNFTSAETTHFLYQLPQIKVLNDQYLSAAARINLAERDRYPDPTIGILGGQDEGPEGNKPMIGVSVSIPLFVRNSYRAEVNAASYDAVEADKKQMELIRQASAEIENSAKRYQTLYQTTQQWQQISDKPLTDGMTLIERLWQAGEINATDYLVQLKQRIDSQIAGRELKGETWQAWVEWLKASGQIETWVRYH
jgi:cobalt-zinc-cadmium efflux system outer membrane protein